MPSVQDRLQKIIERKGFVLLDGAMGTELERHGYQTRLPLWSALANRDAQQMVHEIHMEYIRAGADILTTNTFRTTRYTLEKTGQGGLSEALTRYAVDIARQAAAFPDRDILVAGSIAPIEDCYSPELVPPPDIIHEVYQQQIAMLALAGVDFILIETMINDAEIRIAMDCCEELELPYMVSLVVQDGHLLDGTPLDSVVPVPDNRRLLAVLLNCRSTDQITTSLSVLRRYYQGLIGAYGNGAGHPDPEIGWCLKTGGIEEYISAAKEWYGLGARIIGGCCGTTPDHIQALRDLEIASNLS